MLQTSKIQQKIKLCPKILPFLFKYLKILLTTDLLAYYSSLFAIFIIFIFLLVSGNFLLFCNIDFFIQYLKKHALDNVLIKTP